MANAPKPKIVVVHNEHPDWSAADKNWALKFITMLTEGLRAEQHTVETLKFFDDLAGLTRYDPREWLVWNWGEEWAGKSWSEYEVTAQIERYGFAYTGAPTETLEFACNRLRVKEKLLAAGLPTLQAQVFTSPEAAAREWHLFPAIVKGANQHASFGISGDSIVHTSEQLAQRVAYMRQAYNDDSLVEQFLDSREFQVAVWGNGNPQVLPPMEFDYSMFKDMRDRLYTYDWKFDHGSRGYTEMRFPCPAPEDKPQWRKRLEEVALATYKVMGLRDYGRVDLRMLNDEPQVLDVNPNPDLDHISVLYTGAKLQGLTYGQMAAYIVECAAKRMPA